MAGISSEAAKGIAYPANKKKYNGIEETTDLGLNQYDAPLRILDPQIAIWWQVDPQTENMEMWSPYTSNYDNPIRYEDKLGNTPQEACCPGALNLWQTVMQQAAANGPQLGKVIEVVGTVAVAAYALYELMPTQKEISAANTHNATVGEGIVVGNSYTMGTTNSSYTAKAESKKFDGQSDTNSPSSNAAHKKAKDQNGVPVSQQPDKTIKPNTPAGDKAGLDNRNVKQYEYTNSKGEKVVIRQDKPATYPDGGKQPAHFNAGQNPNVPKDLKQHHNIIPFLSF